METFHISGEHAALLRKHFGLSREHVGRELNCSASTVKNWENKTIIPPKYNQYIISIVEPDIAFDDYNEFVESIKRAKRIDNMKKEKVKGITYCTDFSILKLVLEIESNLSQVNIYHEVFRSCGFVSPKAFLIEIRKYFEWGILEDQGRTISNSSGLYTSFYKLNVEAKDYANKMLAEGYSENEIENEFSTLKFKKTEE